jgi:hypothetical protein
MEITCNRPMKPWALWETRNGFRRVLAKSVWKSAEYVIDHRKPTKSRATSSITTRSWTSNERLKLRTVQLAAVDHCLTENGPETTKIFKRHLAKSARDAELQTDLPRQAGSEKAALAWRLVIHVFAVVWIGLTRLAGFSVNARWLLTR